MSEERIQASRADNEQAFTALPRAAALLPRRVLVQGAASTLLAYRALDRAAGEVEAVLRRGDLDLARRVLGRHLVSRATAELCADEVTAAAPWSKHPG